MAALNFPDSASAGDYYWPSGTTGDGVSYTYVCDSNSPPRCNWVASGSAYLNLSGGTMTGALTLSGAPTATLHAATKAYVDATNTAVTNLSNTASATALTIESSTGTNTNLPAATSSAWGVMTDTDKSNLDYAKAGVNALGTTYLPLTGGTLTGTLTLSGAPTNNLHAATKAYVDSNSGGGGASVTVQATAPTSPSPSAGDMWWDSSDDGGSAYIYYNDGNTSQWVPLSAGSPNPDYSRTILRDESASQTMVGDLLIPATTGGTSNSAAVTKLYVDTAVTAEDFWDRDSGTSTLSPNTASDNVSIAGDLTVNTDALFVDASAKNVGIGTASPVSLGAGFTEAMISGANEGAGLQLQDTDGNVKLSLFTSDVSGAGVVRTITNHPLTFRTNNTEAMRIDSSGNVGIGTTAGSGKLNIVQVDATGLGSATSGGINIASAGGAAVSRTNSINFIPAHNTNYPVASLGFVYTSASGYGQGDLFFATRGSTSNADATERMRIDSSGRVGIGSTAPGTDASAWANQAVVKGSSYTGITIAAPSTLYSSLYFADDDSSDVHRHYKGYIDYNHATDIMQLGSNHTGRMQITSNGTINLINSPGINFSGISSTAHSGTVSSNTLDDYEEGTWIPSLRYYASGYHDVVFSSGSNTGNVAKYIKIGNKVTCTWYTSNFTLSTGANAGSAMIAGLPFSSANHTNVYWVGTFTHTTGFTKWNSSSTAAIVNSGYVPQNATYCTLMEEGTTSAAYWGAGTMNFMITVTYFTP